MQRPVRDHTKMSTPIETDVIVIGGGVIGLACARALALAKRDVVLLERGAHIAEQTSSRNSEVIHAGLYYPTGSYKARFCVAGRRQLYAYLDARNIDHSKCGKLIVAHGESQDLQLRALQQKAIDNGVEGISLLTGAQARALEPALSPKISSALHSSETGILDSHSYYMSLLADFEAAGGVLVCNSEIVSGKVDADGVTLSVNGDETYRVRANAVINAAGLDAIRVARAIDGAHIADLPTPHFAKGHYFSVSGAAPFKHLIYPMPNNAGLGTHLTLDLSGRARLGPDVAWLEQTAGMPFDYAVPEQLAAAFHSAAQAYWPALRIEQLNPDYAGIRPKLVDANQPAADFRIQTTASGRLINLMGIESPGLTASLALAEHVARLAA
jgi:L-2-hydroxyglutarate oxidase LhgO